MTIPKIVFQTSFYRIPKYIEDLNKSKCVGWTYKFFTDEDIIKFIEENPVDEFKECVKVFNSFSGAHKADFFRYYFLYINGGVYIDSDAILEQNIDDIIENCSFFTVKSALNNSSVFNGFIGCEPKNDTIYKALKNAYNTPSEKLKTDYFLLCKNLYKIVEYKIEFEDFFVNNNLLFDEVMSNDTFATTLNNKKEVILKHYFNKDYVIPPLTLIKNALKSVSATKVGVSFDMRGPLSTLFLNGIKQNALYFYDLLLNAGYDSSLIVENSLWSNINTEIGADYKLVKQSDLLRYEYDIVFIFGCQIKPTLLKYLKHMDTKIVFYVCGNHYLLNSEKLLYNCEACSSNDNHDIGYKSDMGIYDEVWIIPQNMRQNKYYLQTMLKTNCIEAPFIWSAKSIELSSKIHNIPIEDFLYKNRGPQKKIAIFEPNMSIIKWALPALLVCENAYTSKLVDKNIDHVYITNTGSNKKTFISRLDNLISTLDMKKNGIISIETRYNTLQFMSKHADIAVSHQWENPLNYLYFDLAWMGWPIIHNAHLCKDVGYYYEGFNYEEGGCVLSDAILNHDQNYNEYLVKNREAIDRYLPTNKILQGKYIDLITAVLTK